MSAPKPPKTARDKYVGYLRYTGLGLTMMGIILVFTFAGRWVDRLLEWRFPLFTVVLALAGVTGAMLYLFKETGRK
jgi:hypothetical protein